MKTISYDALTLLMKAFSTNKTTTIQGSPLDSTSGGYMTFMGREFFATTRVQHDVDPFTQKLRINSVIYGYEPVDGEWRIKIHDLVTAYPQRHRVNFVGSRAAFERDLTMLKFLVHGADQ